MAALFVRSCYGFGCSCSRRLERSSNDEEKWDMIAITRRTRHLQEALGSFFIAGTHPEFR